MKLTILALALTLGACATSPYTSNNPKVRMTVDVIEIGALNETNANGVMKLNVSALSTSVFEQQIRYRVVWFDANHGAINSTVSSWQTRTLQAKEPFDFSAVAPSSSAASYVIDFEKQ